jgi:protein-disulfide isomerase
MHLNNALIAAMALAAGGCGQPKTQVGQPLARLNGQVITADDLNKDNKELGTQLAQLELQHQVQIYQTKRQALEGMIQKRLFEAKAKEAGVASPEELIQKEIAAKIPDPSDEEVQGLYEQAKASGQQLPPIDQIKPDIVRYIKSQKMRAPLMAYYDNLKKEQKVSILLLPPKTDAVEAKGPTKGPKDAPITIVEYSDYQCPYCIQAEKTVSDVLAAYPDKIRLVYRDFPLPMHPLAPKAAEASHCADAQGKYWQMHDKMFGAQGKLEVESLKQYAREVGVDGDKFDKCLDGGDMAKVVSDNHEAGERLGISGTPAFFVNGRFLNGAQPLEEFKSLIDAELGVLAKK